MKKGGLKTIVSELQGASKMHLRQSKEIEKHIDDMGSPAKKTSQQTIVGENTGDVKQDKKGRDYALTLESSIASNKGDTIRPAGKKFPKAVVGKSLGIQGSSLMGGDYSVTKTGDKTSTINNYGSPVNFKGANSSNSSCWKGYKKVGTKKSPSGTGETVNDCKKI